MWEQDFEDACAQGDLSSGVVLTAEDTTGRLRYAHAFGKTSLNELDTQTMRLDSVFQIASCSKIVTTVAALQAVEEGLVTLDEDIGRVLPELNDMNILVGFDKITGTPMLIKKSKSITLRQLLTHSSGISYDFLDPKLQQYQAYRNRPASLSRPGTFLENYSYPLVFEPGTSWSYGAGLDWVGLMVKRLNNNISLQDYMEKNIFQALGITDMVFHLDQREDMHQRIVSMSRRKGSVTAYGTAAYPDEHAIYDDNPPLRYPPSDEYGGSGLFATAVDFQKLLSSICKNDSKVLKPYTVDQMFKPQLSAESHTALMMIREDPEMAQIFGQGQHMGAQLDWGLGGMLNLNDTPTGRKRNTIFWTGMPNLLWWIDREAGLSGTYFSALVPTADRKSSQYFERFETAMYEKLHS